VALERPGHLDSMRVGAVLKAPLSRSVLWYPKACSSTKNAFEAALKAPRWLGEAVPAVDNFLRPDQHGTFQPNACLLTDREVRK
jgi:hypothetical protein